ncbi:MAG: barstar family protein [Clostridia bacterium]|nr:barstar family protein [Clostridia bacterium]
MKIVELDLTGCKYWDELHRRIREAFGFDEDTGRNWNAFWDMMRSECDADKVIIKGEHTMPKEFAEQLAIMHEVLDDTVEFRKEHNFNSFSYEIID